MKIKFNLRQLKKIAEQLRLLSWGQGAIIFSQYGFNFHNAILGKILVFIFWIICQIVAVFIDGKVEK